MLREALIGELAVGAALKSFGETRGRARGAATRRATAKMADAKIDTRGRVMNWDVSWFIGTHLMITWMREGELRPEVCGFDLLVRARSE
jgi:hypothetical protein